MSEVSDRSELPRRQLLGHAVRAAAAAGALQMFGSRAAVASPKPDGVRAATLTVDVHHHMLPDFFFRETNEASNPVGGIKPPAWSKELMLSFMDEAEIDAAVMSISTPGVHVGDDRRALALAARLQARGFDVRAVRPPSVPEGTARLRLSITLNVGETAIEKLFKALAEELRVVTT